MTREAAEAGQGRQQRLDTGGSRGWTGEAAVAGQMRQQRLDRGGAALHRYLAVRCIDTWLHAARSTDRITISTYDTWLHAAKIIGRMLHRYLAARCADN